MWGLKDGHGDEGNVRVGRLDHASSLLALLALPTCHLLTIRHWELFLKLVLAVALCHGGQLLVTGVGFSVGIVDIEAWKTPMKISDVRIGLGKGWEAAVGVDGIGHLVSGHPVHPPHTILALRLHIGRWEVGSLVGEEGVEVEGGGSDPLLHPPLLAASHWVYLQMITFRQSSLHPITSCPSAPKHPLWSRSPPGRRQIEDSLVQRLARAAVHWRTELGRAISFQLRAALTRLGFAGLLWMNWAGGGVRVGQVWEEGKQAAIQDRSDATLSVIQN